MKLLYCHCSLYNPGGMERVLLNKVRWIKENTRWEVVIATTDQQGRPTFYEFPEGVRIVDLGINYSVDNPLPAHEKIFNYFRKRRLHRKRLTELLMQERPDVTISLFPSESSFIPDIKDGSKKVLELHFNRYFRLQYGRKGILGLADRWRSRQDVQLARRFDSFVVLTNEDKGYWGDMSNIGVIPNAALPMGNHHSDVSNKRIIAVGRLDYQKGFDRLLEAWDIVQKDGKHQDWHLDIYGQGEWKEMLQQMIDSRGLSETATLHEPTTQIGDEYVRSGMLVMSSHYEGFPMVMIEAMACGLPVVSFDFKCGPRDIIDENVNGILVHEGDISGLARAMMALMDNDSLRHRLASNARRITEIYSEENVMGQWVSLFEELAESR